MSLTQRSPDHQLSPFEVKLDRKHFSLQKMLTKMKTKRFSWIFSTFYGKLENCKVFCFWTKHFQWKTDFFQGMNTAWTFFILLKTQLTIKKVSMEHFFFYQPHFGRFRPMLLWWRELWIISFFGTAVLFRVLFRILSKSHWFEMS